jgi:hypothetical protein|tara:strand:- start:60 stop:368 length:309 start_codon:yes stop_codon:yes gene_type:complete
LYSEAVDPGEPGLVVRLFAPSTGILGGQWNLNIYYPFGGEEPYDQYFHAELGDFNCNGCNTISNQLESSDCGDAGKGDFADGLYACRGYGGKVEIIPCRKSP